MAKSDYQPWGQESPSRPKAEKMCQRIRRFLMQYAVGTNDCQDAMVPGSFYIRNVKGEVFRVDVRMVNPLVWNK